MLMFSNITLNFPNGTNTTVHEYQQNTLLQSSKKKIIHLFNHTNISLHFRSLWIWRFWQHTKLRNYSFQSLCIQSLNFQY